MQRLVVFLAALWWGGLSGLSFAAVPVLFASLGPAMAGPIAARLFSLQCWAGLVIGLALLLILRRQHSGGPFTGEVADPDRLHAMQQMFTTMGFVLAALLLALLQEFGVAQKIVTARATGGDLRLWHGLGTLMVFGQWLCTGAVLARLTGSQR